MLLARYRHRLPADYDMTRVRDRVAQRGPAWDDAPGLAFKAFTIEDRATGAAANAYASLYLWLDPAEAADFLAGPGFSAVVASFGRPRVETWLPFDVRSGPAAAAAGLTIAERPVPEAGSAPGSATDLATERVAEIERGRAIASEADVLVTVCGLDPASWRLVRFTLRAAGTGRPEIAHLAAPGLAALRAARS